MQVDDHWIGTPQGRLFARSWQPDTDFHQRRPTILLLHDSLGCVELWRDFPERLAGATRLPVVAYDRLGFGRSDSYPGVLPLHFIIDEAATTVPMLCSQLGLETLIPLGHSVGGGMAVTVVAHLPECCVAVVTVAAQAFVEARTLDGIRSTREAFADPTQFGRLSRYHGDKARWVLDAWTGTWLAPAFADWSLNDELPRVRCPILVVRGEHDEYVSGRHSERIGALAAGPSEIVTLPNCGHVPHRECPNLLQETITQFLAAEAPAQLR
jgi:pimeloyl-ACP methyl ester carboxylesterase